MDSKDIPPWYRAYSKFQLKAANELQAAIRDDVEQETTHRIRHCLSVLGLVPLPKSKNLQLLMKLSGGNDLAFLWFLMEFYYKTPGDTEYSINEQIILSGIAHLDMITTLRGLDRILPPGHLSKRRLEKYRERLKRKVEKKSEILAANKEKGKNIGKKLQPYFQKLERPREQDKGFLISERPDFKVRFSEYEKYKDDSYQPPNEGNRWFTFYHVRDAVRVSVVELRSLFDDFFKTIDFRKKRSSQAIRIIDETLDQIDAGYAGLGYGFDEPSLCVLHQREGEELKRKEQIRQIEEKNKCLQKLDFLLKENKQRIERIREALLKEVKVYREQIRKELKRGGGTKNLLVLDKDNRFTEEPYQHENINPDCTEQQSEVAETHAAAATNTKQTTHAQEQINQERPSLVSSASSRGSKNKTKKKKEKIGAKAPKGNGKRASGGGISFNRLSQSRPSYSERRTSRGNAYYDYAKMIPKQLSRLFFQAATQHQPYKFLYDNIFNDEFNVEDSEKFIKNVTVEALNINKRHQPAEMQCSRDKPLKLRPHADVGNAAKKLANEIWEKELATQRTIIHDTRKAIGLESAEDLVAQQYQPERLFPADIPQLEFYDCDDKELMHRMLEVGLQTLAKNHKYVLASIPGAHKLPDLREWIYQRYGKTYTQAELVADFKASQQLVKWLIKMKTNVKVLSPKDIGKKLVLTYDCHKHLTKKVAKARNTYFNRISVANMEFARLIWFSMNDYLCSLSQRGVFFSYLPQRVRDLHLVNPWKLHHVKQMKTMWERRQLKIAREALLKF
ncbi:uncharacterized protein [Eurosta solidaginis]|uniref:uncharacterized protein n=1 Tax=Eurosta solidaginis TaxID=178769 RepID=UPI0035305B78